MSAPLISSHFTNAVHNIDKTKRFETEMEIQAAAMGNLSEGQVSSAQARTVLQNQTSSVENEKRKKAQQDAIFLSLLDDMRQRLDELDARMDQQLAALKEEYGEDAIRVMAETYLNDDELEGLKTDQDRLKALSKKMLNPDGTIKEAYKDLPIAQYVKDWQEAEKLRAVVAKYEGRNELTAEEKREVYETAQSAGLAGQDEIIVQAHNAETLQAAEQAREEHVAQHEQVKSNATLTFG